MAQITIPLYYDLDLLLWTSAAGGIARQPNLVLGQSDEIDFAVQFVQGGVAINLPPISSIICGIKAINDVSGVYLANTTSVTQTGDGATRVYTFTLLLDSVELRAWLLTVTAASNYAAFSILSAEHKIATLPAIICTILPDYNLTGTTPTAASGTLIVDSEQTFTVHKTFAMPTDDGFDTYVLKTNGAGVGSWAADSAGTGTVTSVAQSFTGGIISVSGTPVTSSGTLALTVTGTSGGIPYFSSGTAWATSGVMGAGALVVGGGTGATPTALAAVASGRVLTSAGTLTTPAYSSTITLGASGTLGTITLGNATSGTILITPPTGALGTVTLTLPITTTTIAGLGIAQTFTAAQTFSSTVSLTLDTDATSSTAGAVMISGGLAVAKKLYVGTTLFLSNGHRVTFFTSTTTTSQPTLYGADGGAGQGTITFGSFGADGTTSLYGGISGAPASVNCYKAELNCSYVTFAPSGGLKDSGGNIALTVTSNKQIAMGGTLAVTGTTTLTGLLTANGGVTVASGQALKLGNAATTGLTPGVLAATTNATLTITDSTGQVYRIPCII